MRGSFFIAFALCVLALPSEAEVPTTEPNNRIMEVTVTSDSLEATSVSPEYLVPKPQRLLQILMRKWSKIMKKFNSIAQTDGLTDIEIIRRRELGIVA